MPVSSVELNARQDIVKQPIVWRLGKLFNVVTNIRRANLSHDRGWVILEVVGTAEAIEKSLTWAREQGVRIEPAAAEAT